MITPTTFTEADETAMRRAISLAKKGCYSAHPNPMVGCVLMQGDVVIGEGCHLIAGQAHAEVNAMDNAISKSRSISGATAYVTLEPCCHYGRTPPCVESLIEYGVAKVIVGCLDTNPLVSGDGVKRLQAANISILVGCLENECRLLNRGFFKRVSSGLPYIRVKLAMSLDGRTAMQSGESKWITGVEARLDVQKLRARSGAIITGIGTVTTDDPALTVRVETWDEKPNDPVLQPLKVILDSALKTPLTAKILCEPSKCLIICLDGAYAEDKFQALQALDVEVISLQSQEDSQSIPLKAVLALLAEKDINDVMIEAGSQLSGAFIQAGLVDELWVYIAPILMGKSARALFDIDLLKMADKYCFEFDEVSQLGRDLRVIGRNIRINHDLDAAPC